jgi:hypothetical protein
VHDFNAGIHPYPDGVFWTVQIPPESLQVHLGDGRATLQVANQSVRDYYNIPNSLNNGDSVAATVSYTIHWDGVTGRRQVRNTDLRVAGLFVDTAATIEWSGSNANGFAFTSSPVGQTTISAQIGHERNGVFFS